MTHACHAITPRELRIVDRLREFYTMDEVRRWLLEPHPQLDGRTAAGLMMAGHFREVEAIIDRLDACAYL